MVMKLKDPYKENQEKAIEIERKRREKGEAFDPSEKQIFPTHMFLTKPGMCGVIDVDESAISKWVALYTPIAEFEITPLIERSKWEELNT
jgi:hypothetical protein